MLDLADTSIKAFKKRSGNISLHLRSYLLIKTNVSFSLSYYMKDIHCSLTLPDGSLINFDKASFSHRTIFKYNGEIMVHDFWASTITDKKMINPCLGKLRIDYRISFTGHPAEEWDGYERLVPVIKRY